MPMTTDASAHAPAPETEPKIDWADTSSASWPVRVNGGVETEFGFDFLRSREFVGTIRANPISTLRIFAISCEPHLVYRAATHLNAETPATYFLTLQVSGSKHIEQYGTRTRLSAGQFAVYDSDAPLALDVGHEYRSINLRFPKSVVPAGTRAILDSIRGSALPVRDGISRFVWSALTGLNENAADLGVHARELSRHAIELASLLAFDAVSGTGGTMTRESANASRLDGIKSFVERHLSDPELTVESVAAAHYISVRTLHKMFSDSGCTAACWIRDRRIARAKALLSDPRDERPITGLAQECGFTAMSHFSQLFRREVGLSPSDFRRRSRGLSDSGTSLS